MLQWKNGRVGHTGTMPSVVPLEAIQRNPIIPESNHLHVSQAAQHSSERSQQFSSCLWENYYVTYSKQLLQKQYIDL